MMHCVEVVELQDALGERVVGPDAARVPHLHRQLGVAGRQLHVKEVAPVVLAVVDHSLVNVALLNGVSCVGAGL